MLAEVSFKFDGVFGDVIEVMIAIAGVKKAAAAPWTIGNLRPEQITLYM